MRRRFRLIALLAVAACAAPPPTPPVPQPEARLSGPACLAALAERGAAFDEIPAVAGGAGCGVENAVSLSRSVATLDAPVTIGCTMALVLNRFEQEVVQPAALRRFGQPIARIQHMGGYACRNRSSGGRLSEHALGRAIDIAGFELQDGTLIRVEQDWRRGAKGRFLEDVARGACRTFSVVLTPNHDRDHHDHLHLDIGPWPLCGL